jgi:hypothetical protein
MSAAWFERAFARLAVTEQKLFPSWWLSSGLMEAANVGRGPGGGLAPILEALKFLALLVANGMLLHLLAGWLARVAYRQGYSQLFSELPQRRQRPIGWFDQALVNAGSAAGRPLRLLLVKDLRLFRRDISQWSQFLIFFGLLGLRLDDRLPQPGGRGAHPLDVHDPFRLSDDQPRGSPVLDSGPAAGAPRPDRVVEVPVLVRRGRDPVRGAGAAQ